MVSKTKVGGWVVGVVVMMALATQRVGAQPADGAKLHIGSTKINTKDGTAMVWVPAGEFLMGSSAEDVARVRAIQKAAGQPFDAKWMDDEQPQRRVYLGGYWMYKNDVTVAQYRQFCAATRHALPKAPQWGLKDDHPVVNVSWNDAVAYCAWAGVRLPSEAEWEKAARGADGRLYPWGNSFDATKLWSAVGGQKPGTAPVGSFPAGKSPYGCLDMVGNVAQWCADWYGPYRVPDTRNPKGALDGKYRVLRGGSWFLTNPAVARAASRYLNSPGAHGLYYGFRCAAGT